MASHGMKRCVDTAEKSENRSKKAKYTCKFTKEWVKDFSFTAKSHKGVEFARCRPCSMDINITRGGRNNVTKHVSLDNHKKNLIAASTSSRITSFITRETEEADKVIYAETKFTMFVGKNNLPFSICDEYLKMVVDMFPDSELAKKYAAGKTKITQIIKVCSTLIVYIDLICVKISLREEY